MSLFHVTHFQIKQPLKMLYRNRNSERLWTKSELQKPIKTSFAAYWIKIEDKKDKIWFEEINMILK